MYSAPDDLEFDLEGRRRRARLGALGRPYRDEENKTNIIQIGPYMTALFDLIIRVMYRQTDYGQSNRLRLAKRT